MGAVDLTAERLHEVLRYDQDTGVFVWRISKGGAKAGNVAGCPDKAGYIKIRVDGTLYFAHRLAWLYMSGSWPVGEIDHKDTVHNHNWWANLRQATSGQNKQNRRTARADNKSGLLGVSAHYNRWQAMIKIDGKKKYIGRFATPELAHAAYLEAKARLHPFQTLIEPGI